MPVTRLQGLEKELRSLADPEQAAILGRFFKTGPGQYGAGDVFLGIKVPSTRKAIASYGDLELSDLERLLGSPFHEFRLAAALLLVRKAEQARTAAERGRLASFYLRHASRFNNWDLVDLSAPAVVGAYLYERQDDKLWKKLARSRSLWERRIAIVSTFAAIRQGSVRETFRIARLLLDDREDLIHKATGWMLREAGKRVSRRELEDFLEAEAASMPRTALRYALEHFPEARRKYYMSLGGTGKDMNR